MRKHLYETSREAFKQARTNGNLFGDLLIIDAEGVVGIAGEYPVAVTANRGKLYACQVGYAWQLYGPEVVFAAIREARSRGHELDRHFARFAN